MVTWLDFLGWLLGIGASSSTSACEGAQCEGDISPGMDPNG